MHVHDSLFLLVIIYICPEEIEDTLVTSIAMWCHSKLALRMKTNGKIRLFDRNLCEPDKIRLLNQIYKCITLIPYTKYLQKQQYSYS